MRALSNPQRFVPDRPGSEYAYVMAYVSSTSTLLGFEHDDSTEEEYLGGGGMWH